MIPWWNTEINAEDQAELNKAFQEKRFSLGPVSEEFGEALMEHYGQVNVLTVPSGTAALTLALMSFDVGPGDKVIVPNLTWVATAQAAKVLGAEVVIVDCQKDSQT